MKMKFFVLALIYVFGTVQAGLITEEQKGKILEFGKQCLEETHADEVLVRKAAKGEFVDDPMLKRHLLCFNKKAGFQDEAGELLMDNIKVKLDGLTKNEKLSNELIAKCAIKKDTPENTAFEALKCFHNSSPEKDLLNP